MMNLLGVDMNKVIGFAMVVYELYQKIEPLITVAQWLTN
jgi:hypothetical protein